MNREEVFEAINRERDYQETRWGRKDDTNKTVEAENNVGDFIVYMQRYLDGAGEVNNPVTPNDSLIQILKVVSLGVACLEKFGVEVAYPATA